MARDEALGWCAYRTELSSGAELVGRGCTFELFGAPSAELVEASRGLDLSIFRYFQGK